MNLHHGEETAMSNKKYIMGKIIFHIGTDPPRTGNYLVLDSYSHINYVYWDGHRFDMLLQAIPVAWTYEDTEIDLSPINEKKFNAVIENEYIHETEELKT